MKTILIILISLFLFGCSKDMSFDSSKTTIEQINSPKDTVLVIISNIRDVGYKIEVFDIKTNLKIYEAQHQPNGNLFWMLFFGFVIGLLFVSLFKQ